MKLPCYSSNYTRIAGLCMAFLLTTSMLYAQRHTTARNMGLGGGGTAYMNDFHANFINPANLMLSDKNVTVGLFGGISTSGGGQLVNFAIYNDYFTTGRAINEDLTVEISDKLFGSQTNNSRKIGIGADAVLFGFNIKGKKQAVSAAARLRTLSSFSISKGLFELGLAGLNEKLFEEYKAVNISGDVLMVGEVSVGYSREVWSTGTFGEPGSKRLFAGVAPKLMVGLNYYNTQLNSRLKVSEDEMLISHIFDYQLEAAGEISEQMSNYYTDRNNSDTEPVLGDYLAFDEIATDMISIKGSGMGLDMGVTYEMVLPSIPLPGGDHQILRLSLSATDLGTLVFDETAERFSGSGQFDWRGLNYDTDRMNAEFDSSFTDYASHVQDSIGTNVYGDFSPENISGMKIDLMPMINFGAAYSAGKWNMMFDLGKGLNSRGMNSRRLSSAFGIEYNLFNIFALRGGVRTGGQMGTAYSLGTGLNLKFLELTVGAMTSPNPFDNNINIGAAWSGLVLRF